jgi:hypothetical protein
MEHQQMELITETMFQTANEQGNKAITQVLLQFHLLILLIFFNRNDAGGRRKGCASHG